MTKTPLVSVIVPVFNVVNYVQECIHSITQQSYSRLEIIIIDDGSTDGSSDICDELAVVDSRICVYHKENGGLSDARNYGLAQARGEWVSFIDSDDYVSPIFIETLLDAAMCTKCEIAAFPYGKPFMDGEDCSLLLQHDDIPSVRVLSQYEYQKEMLYQHLDTGAPWRLYRRDVLGKAPFPIGLYYEDLASIYKIVHKVDRVALIDCCLLYAYRQRSTSIIRQTYSSHKKNSALTVANQLYRDVCMWYPNLAAAAASRCFSICRMVFAQIPIKKNQKQEMEHDRDELWDVLVRYRSAVVCDVYARKRERLAAGIAYLGKGAFTAFCYLARKIGLLR